MNNLHATYELFARRDSRSSNFPSLTWVKNSQTLPKKFLEHMQNPIDDRYVVRLQIFAYVNADEKIERKLNQYSIFSETAFTPQIVKDSSLYVTSVHICPVTEEIYKNLLAFANDLCDKPEYIYEQPATIELANGNILNLRKRFTV